MVQWCFIFGAPKNGLSLFRFPIYLPWSDGTRCHNLHFLMLSFKSTFSLSLSSKGSLVLHFLPYVWCHLCIWSYWYFSQHSWFQLMLLPAWRFTWCTLHFVVVQSLSRVRHFVTEWTAAHLASLSFSISRSLLKLMSIELVMPSNHLIIYCPLLPSVFLSIRVFSNESALRIRWPKYWTFSFSTSPSNEYSGLNSFKLIWSPCSPRDSQEFSPAPQFKTISSLAVSLCYGPTLTSIHDYWKNQSFDYTHFWQQSDVFAF